MIQRIQSVYLLLAGILSAITFFMPLAYFPETTGTYVMYATSFKYLGENLATGDIPSLPWGVLLFALLCVIIPVYCIFKYRNRRLQSKLCVLGIICHILYYVAYVAYGISMTHKLSAEFTPTLYIVLPFFAMLAVALARKAIKSDEEKVRAADRIR